MPFADGFTGHSSDFSVLGVVPLLLFAAGMETLVHTEGDHQTVAEMFCFPAALSVNLLREAGRETTSRYQLSG